MDFLLRGGKALGHQSLHRVTRESQHGRKLRFLLSAKALEHIIRNGSGVIGSTDTYSHPVEIECSERSSDVVEAIVSRVTTTELEANRPIGQIEVIVDDNQLSGRNLVKRKHRLNRRTRAVHKARECCKSQSEPGRV